jgi:hypothetical protein
LAVSLSTDYPVSSQGLLAAGDSSGVVAVRVRQFGGAWTPVFDSATARSSEGETHWVVRAWVMRRARWVMLGARRVTLRARWVTLRARWVTLRARWVMRRARWVTLGARRVTLRARWVTLRACWVALRARCVMLRAVYQPSGRDLPAAVLILSAPVVDSPPLCPASPSRGGLTGLAGVTTRPAGYPSGGVTTSCREADSTYTTRPAGYPSGGVTTSCREAAPLTPHAQPGTPAVELPPAVERQTPLTYLLLRLLVGHCASHGVSLYGRWASRRGSCCAWCAAAGSRRRWSTRGRYLP